jgi:crotonobetainyl-CoA:carnitine CoA-transferase CaiB-like acyl-CoA transferase
MSRPLSHLRVLDLSRVLAGPWATQFLVDMGAEVIKIERPGEGDDTRAWGPPFVVAPDPTAGEAGLSAYFMCANRGKRSVAIDLADPQGQSLVQGLAARCDIVVENFKVGGLARYGLDYETLAAANPKLVYCSITGFGQTGPNAHRAGYDYLVQGMAGLMSITGVADGEPGAGPVKVGVAISDLTAGWNAVGAILSAVIARDRTGRGCHIDIALFDVTVAALINQASSYLVSGDVPARLGNQHPAIAPYEVYATADGHVILAIGNNGQFQRFCAAAALDDMAQDARFATNAARVAHRPELNAVLQPLMRSRTTADWVALLESRAVPCGPINAIDAVMAEPQVAARGLKRDLHHAAVGALPVIANPVKMSGVDTTADAPPPLLGDATDKVLSELLDLGLDEIARLRNDKVIG